MSAVWWFISFVLVASYPKSNPLWAGSKALKSLFGLLTLIPFFWSMIVLRSVNIHHDLYYGSALLMFVFLLVWVR
ncbi:hypothetical protein ACLKMH_06995 [Psychromonas sp. KJ10-10]|uniref:hypothetical protein n=1 Tax=Psychromonas sp. KJ10-10 TaxID=3391823 RepID=UPI0039B44467